MFLFLVPPMGSSFDMLEVRGSFWWNFQFWKICRLSQRICEWNLLPVKFDSFFCSVPTRTNFFFGHRHRQPVPVTSSIQPSFDVSSPSSTHHFQPLPAADLCLQAYTLPLLQLESSITITSPLTLDHHRQCVKEIDPARFRCLLCPYPLYLPVAVVAATRKDPVVSRFDTSVPSHPILYPKHSDCHLLPVKYFDFPTTTITWTTILFRFIRSSIHPLILPPQHG
jgi:hypothetical protein